MKEKKGFRKALRIAAVIAGIVLVAVLGPIIWFNYPSLSIPPVTNAQLDALDLSGFDRVMIVAHPDDELLWGGSRLITEDWFVVVLSNGDNKVRSAEFKEMLSRTGNRGLILSYPDKIAGRKSNWAFWEDSIRADIRTILSYKPWKQVATHNADGEYGHVHHKATHRLAVSAFDDAGCAAELRFFGKYYKAGEVPSDLTPIDDAVLQTKLSLCSVYESQARTVEMFSHMIPYEEWTAR